MFTARSRYAPTRREVLLGGSALATLGLASPQSYAQSGGSLAVWAPGGSPEFCDLQTKLIGNYITANGLGGGDFKCGIGADTEFTQALLASIAAGNPPDVAMIWETPIALGLQGAFLELDPYLADTANLAPENWPAGLLASCRFKGKTYGLPVAAGVYGIWYNEDMLAKKGIATDRHSFPKTWDEMRRLSKEFTRWDGDHLAEAGFMPPREVETIPIWSALNGSRIYDSDNFRYVINSEQNVEMFEFFVSWLNEEYKGDINEVDRSGAFRTIYASSDGLPPAFQEGRLAGVETGSWAQGDLYAFPVAFERWNVARHPLGPSGSEVVSGTWPNWLVIPKGVKKVEASIRYIDYLSVDGMKEWYQRVPDLPANKKVGNVVPNVVVEKRGGAFGTQITEFFLSQAKIATPMWDSPVQSFAQDRLANAIQEIYLKAAPVKTILTKTQSVVQAELDKVLR